MNHRSSNFFFFTAARERMKFLLLAMRFDDPEEHNKNIHRIPLQLHSLY